MDIATKILGSTGSVKPGEILETLAKEFGLPIKVAEADIHRTSLTGKRKDLIAYA